MFLPWLDVSVGCAFLTWFLDVFLPWSYISARRAFLTWFIPWSDISAELFRCGVFFHMVRCECWAFLTWVLDMFLPWSDVSAGRAFLTWFLDVFLPWSDVSVERAFLTWFIPWSIYKC